MHASGPRNALVALVVALVALAGCAGGNGPEDAVPPTSSSTAPAPSTSAPSTTAPGGGCPGVETLPPEGAVDVSEVTADVDADGADDRVLAYRQSDGERRVAVELAAGGTSAVDASAIDIEGPAPLSVLGGVELGGDGETVLAVTGAGASVTVVGLFQVVSCALTRVSFESGEDVELPVSGAVTHGDGIRCADGDRGAPLVRLSATSTDGETFTATETGYRIDAHTLVEVGVETTTLTRDSDDEEINAYYTIDCPALENTLGSL